MIEETKHGTTYRYITEPSELVGRIMSDYDKGRSICPERWNDPLDYEEDCEDYYIITAVTPDAIGKGYIIEGHLMSTYDDTYDEKGYPCYYIHIGEMEKLCNKHLYCFAHPYHFDGAFDESKRVRVDLFWGTVQEFIAMHEEED